jgi:sugar lactone lactonase YvrE
VLNRNSPLTLPVLLAFAMLVFSPFSLAAGTGQSAPTGMIAGAGWNYRVAARDLPDIDNLVVAQDGSLYATQELPPGTARVIRLLNGEVKSVIPGLNRADGLLLHGKFLYITEETAGGRVLEYNLSTNKMRVLATLNHPEGIDTLPDGDLVVSEDTINGRLLRIHRNGYNAVDVIVGGLSRPEGLVVRPDGAVVFAETETGRVLSYKDGKVNVLVDDLDEPDQVEIAPDGALWITEDVSDGRLLRLKDGALEVVLSGLRNPRGMAFGADGAVWLAEQGRQRILFVHRGGRR